MAGAGGQSRISAHPQNVEECLLRFADAVDAEQGYLGAILCAAGCMVAGAPEMERASAYCYYRAVTGLADLVSSSVLKPVVGRDRPCHEVQLEGEVFPMVHCGNNGSFTSSHAANHMALAAAISMLLLRRRKWLAALLYFWAFLIGYAQIYVGVHYPTDVLGGFLLDSC